MLAQERLREFKHDRMIRLSADNVFLQPHAVVASHEGTVSGLQYSLSALVVNLEHARTNVYQCMFTVFVGAAPVVGEVACNKYVRAIEYVKSFHRIALIGWFAKIRILF